MAYRQVKGNTKPWGKQKNEPRELIKRHEIEEEIVSLHRWNRQYVTKILRAFFDHVARHLAQEHDVYIESLGTLHLGTRGGRRLLIELRKGTFKKGSSAPILVEVDEKVYISFRQSKSLKALIRTHRGRTGRKVDMEKYGVNEEQANDEKLASEGCPKCGRKPERHGKLLFCPVHGSEPFEQKHGG